MTLPAQPSGRPVLASSTLSASGQASNVVVATLRTTRLQRPGAPSVTVKSGKGKGA